MRIIATSLTVLAVVFGGGGAWSAPPDGCPPGLAKKSPACVPPGQAKKWRNPSVDTPHERWDPEHGLYWHGRNVDENFVFIRNPWRYGLDRDYRYYHRDGYVLRVAPETGRILDLIGAVDALLD